MVETPGDKPSSSRNEAITGTAESLNNLRQQQEIEVPLNISTINNVIADAVVENTPPAYIKLKDSIDLAGCSLSPNTETSSLLFRSKTGKPLGSFAKDGTLTPTKEWIIFNHDNNKILMLEVTDGTQTGYAVAPYLKLNSSPVPSPLGKTAPAEPVATVSANSETVTGSPKLAANSPQELLVVGDSITEGIALTSPKFIVDSKRGRTSAQNLSRLQELFATNKFPPNLKSVALYIGVNDLVSGNPTAVATATRNLLGAISFLKEKGIQPVVSTLFLSSSNPSANPDQDPLARNIQQFNEELKALAIKEGIPLINFAAIANPSKKIHPGRAIYSQMTDLINQAIS